MYYASWKRCPSELVSNGYISNHNKMWRPHPKFNVSFYLYFCCFWINVTHINFENIKRTIQRIISDSCFQLKLWFNVDARAPSIPLLNFLFKHNFPHRICISLHEVYSCAYFISYWLFKKCLVENHETSYHIFLLLFFHQILTFLFENVSFVYWIKLNLGWP